MDVSEAKVSNWRTRQVATTMVLPHDRPVSELRRKYKSDVEQLKAKVAQHELERTRQWLHNENNRLDRDLGNTAANVVRKQLKVWSSDEESSPQRARARAHAQQKIKKALAKHRDQFEALLAEADPLSRGVLPANVVKRIICEDLGLVSNLSHVARFASKYIDTIDGHVDYEAMLKDIAPIAVQGRELSLAEDMRKVGRVEARHILRKVAQHKTFITHDEFRAALDDLLDASASRREAMRLFKAMDLNENGKVDTMGLLEACFAENGVVWADFLAQLSRCAETLEDLIVRTAERGNDVDFASFVEVLQEDGAILPSKEVLRDLLQQRSLLTINDRVRVEALARAVGRGGKRNTHSSDKDRRHSDVDDDELGEEAAGTGSSPKRIARNLYKLFESKYARDSRALFRAIDSDQRGSICRKDLSHFLRLKTRVISPLFERFDGSNDGVLKFNDFQEVLMYGKIAANASADGLVSDASTSSSDASLSSDSQKRSKREPDRSRRRSRNSPKKKVIGRSKDASAMARAIRKRGWTSAKLRKHLVRFDTTDCGFLSREQLVLAFKAFPSTLEEREALAQKLDTNGHGSIEIDAAIRAILHPSSVAQENEDNQLFATLHEDDLRKLLLGVDSWKLRRLFFSHDQDGNGFISTSQFCNLLENLRVPATRKQITMLTERLAAQLGTPGSISYADLMRLLMVIPENSHKGASAPPTTLKGALTPVQLAQHACELNVTARALVRRCARIEDDQTKASGRKHRKRSTRQKTKAFPRACIPLDRFYNVLDGALDLTNHFACSSWKLSGLVQSCVIEEKNIAYVEYAPALEMLLHGSEDDDKLRQEMLSSCQKNGFVHRKAVTQVFKLLDKGDCGVLSIEDFRRAMQTLGVVSTSAQTSAREKNSVQRLITMFRAPAKKRRRQRRGDFVDYLELIHWLYSRVDHRMGSYSKNSKCGLLNADDTGTRSKEEPRDALVYPTDHINEEFRLLKEELAGLDNGFFDELEDLKHSYTLSMKRNRDLETHLWEQCAETGFAPPVDETLAARIPEASTKRVERVASSGLARRLRAQAAQNQATTMRGGLDDTRLYETSTLGDRLRAALREPRVLSGLARALENLKGSEDEEKETANLFVVSASSFRRALETRLADFLSESDLDDIVKKFDRDGDGQVRYLEFLDSVRPIAGLRHDEGLDVHLTTTLSPSHSSAKRMLAERSKEWGANHRRGAKSFGSLFESDSDDEASLASSDAARCKGRASRRAAAQLYWSSDDNSIASSTSSIDCLDEGRAFVRDGTRSRASRRAFSKETEDALSELSSVCSDSKIERLARAKEKIRSAIMRDAQQSASNVIDFRLAFDNLDRNRDGKVDRRELRQLLLSCGIEKDLTRSEQRSLLEGLERRAKDNRGLRYTDFLELVDALDEDIQSSPRRRAILEDRLRKDLADLDLEEAFGHDAVSRREFHRLVDKRATVPLSEAEKNDVMELIDQNADGLVCQQELNEFAHGTPSSPLRDAQKMNAEVELAVERVQRLILKLADLGDGKRDLYVAFQAFDKTRAGFVTSRAFASSLRRVGFHLSASAEAALMKRLDPNASGTIDFPTFQHFALHTPHKAPASKNKSALSKGARKHEELSAQTLEDVRRKLAHLRVGPSLSQRLKRFATTHQNAFTAKELAVLLRSINVELSTRQVHQFVNRLDANGSGMVSFAELDAFTSGKPGTMSAQSGRDALLRMAMRKVRGASRNLYQAFRTLAQNRSAYVDQASFEAVLLDSGCKLHDQELQVLYEHSPQNDIGEVQYADFLMAFLDTAVISRQFHAKNPRASSLLETMQRYVGRQVESDETGDRSRMSRPEALRVLRQVGVLAPAWQLEAAVDLALCDRLGDDVNLVVLCGLLTQAQTASNPPMQMAKGENAENASSSGTVAALVIKLRGAVRKSSREGIDAESEEAKRASFAHLDLQTAIRGHLGLDISDADAEVLLRLLEFHTGDKGNDWHWDDFRQSILANNTVGLALEVDADTDPQALHDTKVVARTLRAHLQELAGPSENMRRAFRALDRGRKGRVRMQDLIDVCSDLGHLGVQENPWSAQALMLDICGGRAHTFEKAAAPGQGLDFGTLQRWVFPVPQTLKPNLESVKRALRDTARKGGGTLDASRVLRALDRSGTGRVSQSALRKALGKLCPHMRPNDLAKVANEIFGLISEDGEDIGRAELQRVLTASLARKS